MTSTNKTVSYDQDDDLAEVFVGRRIIKAELGVDAPAREDGYYYSENPPYGRLTLDNGTEVYLVGHEGGCACAAGCYELTRVATVDNIITAVKVSEPTEGKYGEIEGEYRIFVITEAEELNVAEFEGSDGNGYYGTGFYVLVTGKPVAVQ